MSTPTVTEITRRPDPVEHDTFIDELTASTPALIQAVRVARDGFPSTPR